jgi:hypothetical protein
LNRRVVNERRTYDNNSGTAFGPAARSSSAHPIRWKIMFASTMKMRTAIVLLAACSGRLLFAKDEPAKRFKPNFIAKPEAFNTLVNPECSHCRDEALRRAADLKDDDRVLSWIRGYSDGGAIPYRFFLNPYRVISDSYGVFVYDPDAGYARGFAPSYDFSFHGWRNGVMVMKHKDGTLYSCLTGLAFEGPNKGDRLKAVPTLVTDWHFYLKRYPGGVAYKMFEKYQPVELPNTANADSRQSRTRMDQRLPDETMVLGVSEGDSAWAYPQEILAKSGLIHEDVDGQPRVILWYGPTKTAAAYRPLAAPPEKIAEKPRAVTLEANATVPTAPFIDKETGSHWDIAGRAVDGPLQGWTLTWLEGVQVRWFAWAAEYPETSIYGGGLATSDLKPIAESGADIAGPLGNLDVAARSFAILKAVDADRQVVSLSVEGETEAVGWPVIPSAELWHNGWWGRLDQFTVGNRVWVWFKTDAEKHRLAVSLLADEPSEQDLYGPSRVKAVNNSEADGVQVVLESSRAGKPALRTVKLAGAELFRNSAQSALESLKVGETVYVQTTGDQARLILDPAAFALRRAEQKAALRQSWIGAGLPGTVVFEHPQSHEVELLIDHEALSWARSLHAGDNVNLVAGKSIPAEVRQLRPWREHTQVLLAIADPDAMALSAGRRLSLRLSSPPAEAEETELPAGLGQPRSKSERVDWLMSSIYCSCGMHDACAGHFYTLAACDAAGKTPCGLAKSTREEFSKLIDAGRTDRQIFDELLKTRGPKILRPHMSP